MTRTVTALWACCWLLAAFGCVTLVALADSASLQTAGYLGYVGSLTILQMVGSWLDRKLTSSGPARN